VIDKFRSDAAAAVAAIPSGAAGTMLADGTFPLGYRADGTVADRMPERERREFGGREHILEYGIVADFALVKAYQGDRKGNLRFRLSARNFNPLAAMSGRHTFAEVEHLVGTGELGPDDIHLPGVFVDEVLLKSELSPRKPAIAGFSS
jgi:3-oxoacid CoA-transferase subunit A